MAIRRVQRIRVDFECHVAAVTFPSVLCVEAVLLLLIAQGVGRAGLAFLVGVGLIGFVCEHGGSVALAVVMKEGVVTLCSTRDLPYLNSLNQE